MSKFKVANQIEDIELLKLAHKRNFCADNQLMSSFSINAGGRTILIGIDVNPEKLSEGSCHTAASDGTYLYSEGFSSSNVSKEHLIDMAKRQVEKVLEELLTELGVA